MLAADTAGGATTDLSRYLREHVFAGAALRTVDPDPDDVAASEAHLERWLAGLAIERAAVESL